MLGNDFAGDAYSTHCAHLPSYRREIKKKKKNLYVMTVNQLSVVFESLHR